MADSLWKTTAVRQAQWNTERLGQLCFYGINKIEEALAIILYDEGVNPEQRIKIKTTMHRRLEDIAQDMIVEALNQKLLNASRLRESKKKKKRTVIFEKENE